MPNPEDVNPRNYQVRQVIYNDGEFSIAWGEWEDGTMRVAMRWNGEGDNAGYPKTFGNPVWFQLPEDLSVSVLRGILGHNSSRTESIIEVLRDVAR